MLGSASPGAGRWPEGRRHWSLACNSGWQCHDLWADAAGRTITGIKSTTAELLGALTRMSDDLLNCRLPGSVIEDSGKQTDKQRYSLFS